MKTRTLIFLFALVFLIGCYYDNEEELYPTLNTQCDTTNVTFTSSVSQVLANNCLGCHGNSVAARDGNNIKLENYQDVKNQIDKVYGSINYQSGYSKMPKNGNKLDACSISKFRIWKSNSFPGK